MSDPFIGYASGLESPGTRAFDITPDDTNDLATFTRALYITGAGAVKFTTVDGDTVTWSFPDNYIFTMRVRKVFATGTTATGIGGIA